MIRTVVTEGLKAGFSAVDVFEEKVNQQEFENFVDYTATHCLKINRIKVRSFWDTGDPMGFSLCNPDSARIKSAFSDVYNSGLPQEKNNFRHLLPRSAQKIKINIFDDKADGIGQDEFTDLVDRIYEMVVSFPGLSVRKVRLVKTLKKIYLANTYDLNIKYKKTSFVLLVNLAFRDSWLETSDQRVFFDHLDPVKLISRASNLLHALTDNEPSTKDAKQIILSPEAAAVVLREFSRSFKLGVGKRLSEVAFPSVINLVDDPLLDGQVGSAPFDDEGVQSGEKFILKKGNWVGLISDLNTSFHHNLTSTGNGFRNDRSVFPTVRFSNLYIKPSVLSLSNLMREADNGWIVALIKLKYTENGICYFSAYGYRFGGGQILEPIHFYFKTTFKSFFMNILRVSKEVRFFPGTFTIGSPYLLLNMVKNRSGEFEV